jgi:hypothetical protein
MKLSQIPTYTVPRTSDDADPLQLRDLEVVFARLVSVLLTLAGLIAFIMLIVGGFKFITSGGDPKGVEAAKNTLTYAIGGIVVVAASFLILVFIENFTGATVLDFSVFYTAP